MLNETQKMKLTEIYAEREKLSNRKALIPMKKVDNINMPYVEVEMNEGTLCDLNSKPRKTKVLYVCSPDVQHEIYSLKETLSCEYEAVVKTSFLCRHPDYKPKTVRENDINCRPVDKTLKKPKSLMAMDIESMRLRHHKVTVISMINRNFPYNVSHVPLIHIGSQYKILIASFFPLLSITIISRCVWKRKKHFENFVVI